MYSSLFNPLVVTSPIFSIVVMNVWSEFLVGFHTSHKNGEFDFTVFKRGVFFLVTWIVSKVGIERLCVGRNGRATS